MQYINLKTLERNKVTTLVMRKYFLMFWGVLLFGVAALTSCVQDYLYEDLNDEYDVILPLRNKQSKDCTTIGHEYNCGVCCAAYIKSNYSIPGTTNYAIAMNQIIDACNRHNPRINYQNGTGITSTVLKDFFEQIMGGVWNIQSRDGSTTNGMVIPNYFSSEIDEIIKDESNYPMIAFFNENGTGHWVVAKNYNEEVEKGFGRWKHTEIVNEVVYYGPWEQSGGSKNINEIKCVIYK